MDAKLIDFRDVPGPPGWPVIGNLFQLEPARLHHILEGWASTYGSCYRLRALTKRALVLSDQNLIVQVLRERPGTFRRSKTIEAVMEEMGVTGVVSAEGEHWKRQSRLMLQAFNPGHLRSFFPQIATATGRLLSAWQSAASRNSVVDVQGDLMRYATDVVASLAFGTDINTLDGDGNSDVIRCLNTMFPMIHRRVNAVVPYWRFVKLPSDRRFDRSLHELHSAVHAFIDQARGRIRNSPSLTERPANLIEALIAARDEPNSGFSDQDVFGNVFSTLLSGGDGTANMIAWIVYFLCEHPEWQDQGFDEVSERFGGRRQLTDFDQAQEPLPILDAVIQEAMRLRPVFPLLLHEANADTLIGHVNVPAGTIIVTLLRMPGLDPTRFPNPTRFDPGRWTEPRPTDATAASPRPLMPFGSGPRMCAGRLLAMHEIRAVATMLLRNFVAERDMQTPVGDRLKFTMEPTNLRVRLRERSAGARCT